MAAAASERLDGDPLWLLIVAGPGGAKTETVQALAGAGAYVTSTIASEGALLSASPRKQRHQKATGGLLRKIGDHGTLVIKDFTSILSAARETRGMVLAAIREVYDGKWERNVGTDGGQTLTWTGRIVIVAAVTTAWDAAQAWSHQWAIGLPCCGCGPMPGARKPDAVRFATQAARSGCGRSWRMRSAPWLHT